MNEIGLQFYVMKNEDVGKPCRPKRIVALLRLPCELVKDVVERIRTEGIGDSERDGLFEIGPDAAMDVVDLVVEMLEDEGLSRTLSERQRNSLYEFVDDRNGTVIGMVCDMKIGDSGLRMFVRVCELSR